ncbi:hypothetical protein QBC47DRAFT_418374 [Echria macrotheca]|uniref:G domain-containing protein n=1 Tax=Echria macrotheca TaxID=438768 RepID=A0AAJ0B1Q2_9PEZI|nr:hypothetical protein QBC47DRAFT_418374 [Echria macrotheca]
MVTQSIPAGTENGPAPPQKPINILILGETQNGKSTLIKQLGVYGRKRDNNIGIGNGNLSCTTEVGVYPLMTKLRTYYLADRNGRRIKDANFSDLVDYTEDDALVAANEPDHGGKAFRFDLIDTPGLDDSSGNDMEIMANIIARVSDIGYLNALVYVRSLDKPFSESFNRFYEYLRRCMPNLFQGLIIAHTRYTVDREDEAQRAGRNFRKDRRDAFRKATKCSDELSHIFMDNDPDPEMPFQVVQSYNSCHALLDLARSQRPIDVANNVYLLKAPTMINVDSHVLLALTRQNTKLKERLAREMAAASKSKNKVLRIKREISRLNARAAEHQEALDKLDTDDEIVLGRKTVAEDYTLGNLFFEGQLWLDKRDVSYDSDCIISKVTQTTGNGCRWLDVDHRGTTWRATLKSSIFRSINGSATFYTSNRLKHQSAILQLRGRIRDAKESARHQEDILAELDDPVDVDHLAETLQNDVDRCDTTIERIQRDTFDAGLWPALRRFYQSRTPPSKSDIVDFVAIYDPETAKLMSF